MLPFSGASVFGEVAEGRGVGLLPSVKKKEKKRNIIDFICFQFLLGIAFLKYIFYVKLYTDFNSEKKDSSLKALIKSSYGICVWCIVQADA